MGISQPSARTVVLGILLVCLITGTAALGQTFTVSVALAGPGSGTVTSNPAGILCAGSCSANYASGTLVTLTATPSAGSAFTGWSGGGCSGTGSCSFTVGSAVGVTATFSLSSPPPLSIIASNLDSLPLTNHFPVVSGTMNANGDYAVVGDGQALFYRPNNGALVRLLQSGDTLPSPSVGQVDVIQAIRVNDNGVVLGLAALASGTTPFGRSALFTYDGSLHTLVQSTDAAPGASGYSLGRGISIVGFNANGDIAFTTTPITATNAVLTNTLYIRTGAGVLNRIAAVGDSAPGTNGGTFSALSPVIPDRTLPNLNIRGEVLFSAAIAGGNGGFGLFVGSTGGVRKVVSNGDANPLGGSFAIATAAPVSRQNQSGQVAFIAGGQVWIADATSTLAKVAIPGDAGPVNLGGTLNVFNNLLAMNDAGLVAFGASIAGNAGNGNVNYSSVVMTATAGNPAQAVAWTGETAPTTGGTFSSIPTISFNVNGAGQLSFFANISGGTSTRGMFTGSGGGTPVSVLNEGDSLPFSSPGTVTFANNTGVLNSSTILADGSVFMAANIIGSSSDDFAEFIHHTDNSFNVLLANGTVLPAGASVSLRTFYVGSAGNWVAYLGSYSGGALTIFEKNVVTNTTYRVAGDSDLIGGNRIRLYNVNTVWVAASGKIVFSAAAVGGPGIVVYVWDPGTSTVTDVVHLGSLDPVSGLAFTSMSNLTRLQPSSLNTAGVVMFGACVSNSATNCGVYTTTAGGPISRVAFTGDAAPEGGNFATVANSTINNAGQVAFTSGSSTNGAFYIYTPGVGISRIAGTGDQGPNGATFTSVGSFVASVNSAGGAYLNDAGELLFSATLSNGVTGYFTGRPNDTPYPIVLTGDAAPGGGTFSIRSGASDAIIGNNHDVVFRADITGGPANSGYFIRRHLTGAIQTVLLQGQATPDGAATFDRQNPSLNAYGESLGFDTQGQVYLFANVLIGGSSTSQYYRFRTDSVLELAAARGATVPGVGGAASSYSQHPPSGANHEAFWIAAVGGSAYHVIAGFLGDTTSTNADLAVTVAQITDVAPATSGGNLTFTVINNGPAPATGATLTVTIPAGMTITNPGSCSGTTTVTCTLGNIAAGAVAQVSLAGTVDTAGSKTISGTVSSSVNDPYAANNSDSVTITVSNRLSVAITHLPEPAYHGGTVTYGVSATNQTGSVTSTTTTLPLPAGSSYVAGSSSPACTFSAPNVTCTSGALGSNANVSYTVVFTAPAPGSYPMIASVTASPAGSGIAQDTLNVSPAADLAVTATGPANSVVSGASATFIATVTNNGSDVANATVTETLPPGFTFVSATWVNPGAATNGNCVVSTNIVCPVGSLAVSGTATVTTVATAGPTLGIYSLGTTATSSNSVDSVSLNNSAAATAIVALSANARDASVVLDNERGIRLLDNNFVDIITPPPAIGGQMRWGTRVLPNGRIAFFGNPLTNAISVYDLSLQEEIHRIPLKPTSELGLSTDGSTLVVSVGDTANFVDTSTFQVTTVNLNGLVTDNPATADIFLGMPVVSATKAYFNPSGLQNGSLTVGLPLVVVDLATHAVSTITLPTTGRGGANNSKPTIALTPDGRYLIANRTDEAVIVDLTNNTVVTQIPAITSAKVVVTRGHGDPNVFAYFLNGTSVRIVDVRTGSPTFGTVLATIPQTVGTNGFITISADGTTIFNDDNFQTVAKNDVRQALTATPTAITNFYPLLDINSRTMEVVDLTAMPGAPTVTGVSPSTMRGDTATTVTITGTNFAADAVVYGNGGRLIPTSATPTQIQVLVPGGIKTGVIDVVVTNPNLASVNQQNLSGVLRGAFTVLPPASFTLTDKIVAAEASQRIVVVNPTQQVFTLPQTSLRGINGPIALTSDGGYAFVPISDGSLDILNLTTGTHTFNNVSARQAFVTRSKDPVSLAPVMYLGNSQASSPFDLQLAKLDANPASGTFGTALSTTLAGVAGSPIANGMAVSPSGRYVYVSASGTNLTPAAQVIIFDTQTQTRAGNLGLSTVSANGTQPNLLVTPDANYLVLQMTTAANLGLFSLASPTSPVLQTTIAAAVPTGYSSVTITSYVVAKDRLYVSGIATPATGASANFLEVFNYNPAANNFALLYTYMPAGLAGGKMLISSDASKLYINSQAADAIQVIDLAKAQFADPTGIVTQLGAPYAPLGIAVPYDPPAPSYNVALSMAHTPEPGARTGLVAFVVTATNNAADVSSAAVTIPLPANTTFISLNSSCVLSSPNIVCTLGSLAAGQTLTASFALQMPSTTGSFVATGTFNSTETAVNGNAGNNTAQTTVNIQNGADIAVTASASPASVVAGGSVTFTTTVTNSGPDAGTATITETLPTGFTFVSASFSNPTGGTSGPCSAVGRVVTCSMGTMPYSGTTTTAAITLVATASSQIGSYTMGVTAAVITPDTNQLNNAANAPVYVGSASAQDAYIIDDNASAGLLFLNPNTLTQFNSMSQVMAGPRIRPVVSPSGRLLFTGSSHISVVDLSIKAEITRINISPSAAYTLTSDGTTLVVPVGDSVVLVNTATFQTTTININGLIGDDAAKVDIGLGTPAVANGKAYFNPGGLRAGSTTVGLPIVVVDLTTHAVSTIAVPTPGRGANVSFELASLATTPDGHYLVALRRDGMLVIDLTTNNVVVRNTTVATNFNLTVVMPRTTGDPNVFAYVTSLSPRRTYQVDLRAPSLPTFGQVIATVSSTTNINVFGNLAPGYAHLGIAADGRTIYVDDFGKTITAINTGLMQTSPSTAATNTVLTGIDLNSSNLTTVDFSAVAGAPTVTSISPSAITTDGGVTITVNGTNFASGALVRFGQNDPLPSTFVSSTQLKVAIPPGIRAQSAIDVIVTNPNAAGPVAQQNLSGILRGAATVELAASVRLASPLVSAMNSNGVTFVNRKSVFSAIPQNPLHEVEGAGEVTADGGYMFVPVGGDQVNSTTSVNGGVAVVNLANGATTFSLQPVATSFAGGIALVRSVHPSSGAPVMYLVGPNNTQTDVVVEMLDANSASATFGNGLGNFNANVNGSGVLPATFGAAASGNGRYVYAGWENANVVTSTYQVVVFDILNQVVAGSFTPTTLGAAATQRLLSVAPDGNLLMVMANNQDIGVFSLANPISPVLIGTMTGVLPSGSTSMSINAFAVSGSRAYVSATGTNALNVSTPALEIYNYLPATPNLTLINAYTSAPLSTSGPVSISSDGTQLYVTGSSSDSVYIYDVTKLTANDPTAFVASFGTPFGPTKFVSNNAATVPTTDLHGSITAAPNPAIQSGTVAYNFTITNSGPLTATNVVFTDPLPGSTVPVSQPTISCTGSTCSCNNASPVSCSVSSLASGASATGTVVATVPASLGSYTNTAQVVADQAASTANNIFSVTNSVIVGADVSVSLSQPTNPAVINTPVTYTVIVQNNGTIGATAVSLNLEGGGNNNVFTTPSAMTPSQGSCNTVSDPVCDLGSLAAGASATVTVTTTATLPGSWTVQATVSANEPDPILANNTASQTTAFKPSATAVERYVIGDRISGRLRQFSTANNAEVAAGYEPVTGFGLNKSVVMPNGRTAFVASSSSYISVMDLTLGAEVARIPIRARGLALNGDASLLLATNALVDELDVVDTTTFAILQRVSFDGLLGDVPGVSDAFAGPIVVVPTSTNEKAFINASGVGQSSAGVSVIVVDLATFTASAVPSTNSTRGDSTADGIAAIPNGPVVVPHGASLLIINPDTATVGGTIPTLANYGLLAVTTDSFDPRGALLYVSTGSRTNVVDFRNGSATFGQTLINGVGVASPTGFSGGFMALSLDASKLFLVSPALSSTATQVVVLDTAALLNNPAAAVLGQFHLGDGVRGVTNAFVDNTAPATAPMVTAVSPSKVLNEVSTQVVITGTNFSSDARVRFGKLDLLTPDNVTPTQITVTVPAGQPAGTGDVIVINQNAAASLDGRNQSARLANAFTIEPPVAFAPAYQFVGHESGDGAVLSIGRAAQQSFVNQVALVPGVLSPDGSTFFMPVISGLLPFNLDSQTGSVYNGIPNPGAQNTLVQSIDPANSNKPVVYTATNSTGATADAQLLVISADTSSPPTLGHVVRTISAGLNDGAFSWGAAATADGRYVYVAEQSSSPSPTWRLVIFDTLQNTANTVLNSTLNMNATTSFWELHVSGSTLMAKSSTNTITLIDITNPTAPTPITTLTPIIPAGLSTVTLDTYIFGGANRIFAADSTRNVVEVFNFDRAGNNFSALGAYVVPGLGFDFPGFSLAAPPDGSLIYAQAFRSDLVYVFDPNLIVANDPNPIVATLQTGVAPSGLNVSSRTVPNNDLSISMTGPAFAGESTNFQYQVSVHNGGSTTATGVTVIDALPATFVSAANATCSGVSNVSCSLAPIPAGGTTNFSITAQAPANPPLVPEVGYYVMHNTARVTANESDTSLGNNTATTNTNLSAACAPANGYDKAWTGVNSSSWNDAGNWAPVGVPTTSNSVFVCVGAPNQPIVDAASLTNSLLVERNAVLQIASGQTLTASGNVTGFGPINGSGTLIMSGSSATIMGTVPSLTITGTASAVLIAGSGMVTPPNAVTVNGNMTISAGSFTLATQTVIVNGNFSTTGNGILAATNETDVLNVNGAVTFNGGDTTNSLTAGQLTLTGNFTAGGNTPRNFAPADAGSFQVIFNGTTAQTVFLTGSGSSFDQQHFHHFTASNPAGVAFASPVYINGDVTLSGSVTGVGQTAVLGGSVFDSSGDLWQVANTVITAATPQLARMQTAMSMPGAVTLPAGFTLDGPLAVGGNLILNGQTVTVNGDFQTTGSGILTETLPADTLIVNGNVTFNGGDTTQSLSAGVLQLTKNFFAGPDTARNFAPQDSGTHLVLFAGSAPQTINFVGPGSQFDMQHFHNLEINNASGVSVLSDMYVNGSLTITAGVLSGTTSLVVHGNLSDAQGGRVQVASLVLTGGSPSLPAVIASPLNVATPLVLQSDMTVNSSVNVSTNLVLNAHTMIVNGNFQTTGSGILTETDPADALIVNGNVAFNGGDTSGSLSAGLIQLTGNFSAGASTARNFAPQANGNHLVKFVGSAETVSFVGPGGAFDSQHFQNVEFAGPGTVNLSTTTFVNKDVVVSGGTVTGNIVAVLAGSLIDAVGDRWQVSQTQITGSSPALSRMQTALTILNSATLPSGFVLDGPMNVTGNLILNGHTVTVNGDFQTTGSGILTETTPADALLVNGNVTFNGGDTSQSLSDGVLQVTGNFSAGASTGRNFAPQTNGNHVVRFAGTTSQTVGFTAPGNAFDAQHFQDVIFAGPGTVTLASTTFVNRNVALTGGIVNGNVTAVLAGNISDSVGDRWQVAQTQITGSSPHIAKLQTAMTIVNSATLPVAFTVDGPLTVAGNLVLNNQIVTVNGDFQTTGSGILTAVNATDTLIVNGNVTFNGGDTSASLAAGVLQLTGAFTAGGSSGRNFAPQASGSLLVRFVGSGIEPVSFAAPGTQFDQQHFITLEIANVSGGSVNISGAVYAVNASLTTSTAILTGATLYVSGAFTSVAGSQMNATVAPHGSVSLQGTSNSGTFVFDQTNQQIQGNLPNVQVTGTASLAGTTTLSGDLTISGTLAVNGNTLNVGGNLKTTNYTGQLIMNNPSDLVTVNGNADLGGASGTDFWTAGTLNLHGNLIGTNCCNAFLNASGAHTLVMNGTAPQSMSVTVNQANGTVGHLGNLVIANSSGVTFLNSSPAIEVLGNLNVASGAFSGGATVGDNQPAQLRVDGSVNVASGASVALGSISVGGALSSAGVFNPTKVVFNGNTGAGPQVITPGLQYQNIEVATGTATRFNGPTNLTGDLVLYGSALVNAQTVNIAGNLRTLAYTGELDMNNAADVVNVAGSIDLGGTSNHFFWTAGTLNLGGNLGGTNCCNPFLWASSGHTLVMNGSGAQSMMVTHNGFDANVGRLGNLTITNPSGVTFVGTSEPIEVLGNLNVASGSLSGGAPVLQGVPAQLRADGNVNVSSGASITLASISVAGALTSSGTFSPTKTIFNGVTTNAPQVITPGLQYQTVEVATGTSTQFAGTTAISGDLILYGVANVNGSTVNISGDVRTLAYTGELDMFNPADQVNVTGGIALGGAYDHDFWTAGTLRLGRNLVGSNCCNPFVWASGNHTLVLNGTLTQTFLATQNLLNGVVSHLANVVVANPAGAVFSVNSFPLQILGNLTLNPGTSLDVQNPLQVGTLTTTGSTPFPVLSSSLGWQFTANSVDVNGLTISNVPFAIGAGPLTAFNFVTFANMSPTTAQLTIQNPGAPSPFVMNGVQFLTTPSGGTYVSATDTLPSDGIPLVIALQHNFPLDGSALTATANGAVVNWLGNFADLSVSASAGGSILQGNNEPYTFTITNSGPDDAGAVTFTDTLPAGTTFVSADIGGSPCAFATGTITCTAASLAPGGTLSVNVVLQPTISGSITNSGSVSAASHDSNTANNTASATISVTPASDLALTISASPQTAQPGAVVVYTITVQNLGPSDATNVIVADTLPANEVISGVSASQGSCTVSTETCTLGTLTNGSSATMTVTVFIAGAGSVVNSASVTATETDINTANNTASSTVPSIAADLALSGSAPTASPFGSDLTYTFTLANNGPNDANAVTINDTVPASTSFVSANISGTPCAVVSGTIKCSLSTFTVGASATMTVVLHPTSSGTVVNSATVGANTSDQNPQNNTVSATTNVTPTADLVVTGTASPSQVQPGAQVTYTITVSDAGPSDATNAVVTDTLPAGMTLVSATSSQGVCSATTPITCSVGAIANGAHVTVTIVGQITVAGTFANVASASATEADANTTNNSTTINASSIAADIVVTSSASGSLNGAAAYTAVVTNNGPSDATNVVLTASFNRYTFVSATPSTGTCNFTSSTLTCGSIASLPKGGSFTVIVAMQPPNGGWATVNFTAVADQFDPVPTNNAAQIAPSTDGMNTLIGSNVTVDTADSGGSAVVSFAQVVTPGSTSLTTLPLTTAPPAGFRAGAAAVYFDLSTNAQFSGPINLAFRFAPTAFHHPSRVRLFHMEGGQWVDRTGAMNVATGTIAGTTTSLSPFALFEPVNAIPVANAGAARTTPAIAMSGATVRLDGSASTDGDADALTYRWTGPFAEGGGVATGVSPSVTLPIGISQLTLVVNDGEASSTPVTMNVSVADFILAVNGTNSIARGQSASYTVAISPVFGSFDAPVTLTCGSLPPGVSCTFSQSSMTPGANGATATLTINTTTAMNRRRGPALAIWLGLMLGPLGLTWAGKNRRATVLVALLLLVVLAMGVGCGGGSSTSTTPTASTSTTTPAQTVTITVSGTSAGVQHSATTTLTLR